MPNPLDHLYDELKVKYPDFVDRGEFVSKLSNEDELKKLHQAATQSFKGFVGFDDFKNKVGESLSTYDTDSDYRTQNTASTEQKSAEVDNTASQREESRPAPSEPQNSGIESEASVPDGSTDTHVDAEEFDRETGDLDELDRRYQDKVKRLEGYGATEGLYVNEEDARKHYEAYSRLLDEAEQDRLVYNRRVKAADDERAEQQRQLDLQSKDRKTRRSAEYSGYTNDQVRKEQERLKKERAYLEDPKSKRNADYSRRVMEYNADQTALSAEADKRNKSYERKRAMYDEVKTIAEDPDVQKRITGNDTVAYVLSGNNPYALQSVNRMAERAKTMTDEELFDTCKTIAWQKYARGYDRDIYAPLAGSFLACYNELMYRMGGDEPKSAMEMRYDMIDKATEGTPEGDRFMLSLRNYLDGTAGMGTANYETDDSERANIPQFAIADYYKNLVFEKGQENIRKADQRSRYPLNEGEGELDIAAALTDINYDEMLQQAYDKFGEEKLRAYIVAHALHNGISIDESAQRVNQSIWNATIGKEMEEYRPKSNLEFFVRRIFSDNMFSKLVRLGIRGRNGNMGGTDPFALNTMVLDEYAKEHPGWDTAAVVTNFAVMEGPIFSAYGKLASGLVGVTERAILGAALKTTDRVAIEATARTLSQSLMYRLAKGGATGALVGFQYGTMSGAIDQAYYNGDVDFGKVIANGGHMMRDFALMHGVGELFGVTGDAILRRGQRNLRNGQGKFLNRIETASLHFLNNVAKTTTNASIVTGLYAAIDKPALERENKKIEAENKKIEAENARLPEDQQKPLKPLNQIASVEDTFYSSLRMFAGLDAVGMLRSAWSIGVRGQYERNKHVKIHFDKFDREALEKAFGKNPNSLLRQIVFGNVDGVPAKWFEIDPEAEQEIYNELGRELTPAEKEAYATYGFTELRKIILNKDIPWATRAKIVSVVTGRVVQEPPVAKATIDFVMDSSGTRAKRIIVKSIDLEGNVIQIREFDGQREFEAARSLYEALNDRGWRNNAMLCGDLVIDAIEDKTYADTVDEMAREKGIAPEQFEQMVFGIKQKDITGEKVTYQERQLVDEFDKRHQEKQDTEIKLTGPDKLFEQIAREVFGVEWKQAKDIPFKSWGEMTEAEKEFVNKYIERMGAMGVAERNKLMNTNPDWVRTAKEYEESVRRRMEEAERPAEAEPLPALEDEKVSVETPVEERVEPVPEVIELEEDKPAEPEPVKEETPAEERLDAVRRTMKEQGFHVNEYDDATLDYLEEILASDEIIPEQYKPIVREYIDARREVERSKGAPAEEKPDTEGQPQAGTIGFEPVEQPTERERFDAERKAKAATITDADIEANREALGIPEGMALTDEARQIYAEDLAEDLMRYERFKRGESDEKARFHDYWESKFNPKRPKLERPIDEPQEPEEEEFEEDEVTEADALIEQLDNLKGRSDLERYRNALKVFAGDDEIMSILEDLEPHDITEWVSSFLGLDSGKGYSMLWESKTRGGTVIAKGFKEETGWSWNDVKGFAFMFDNKNGMSPRRVAEKIWEELPSGMKDQYSDVDVFNIMMDLFGQSSRKSDLTGYIRNNRMEQVRELLNRRRNNELDEIARYKERERRGDEEPVAPPVSDDEEQNEFAVREDDVAPFSLLSLSYRDEEVESGTIRSRARTRKQLGTIAKALGYKIRWVADKPYNAKIDTDEKVLYVNIRTDRPLESVIGHEITHDLRKSDPKAYEVLKRYAQDLLGQAQWDNEVKDVTDTYNEEYKRRGWQPIRADKAEEEVVCDTMGKVLHTRKGLRELAGNLDPGVAGKVYRLLKGITNKVKSALGKDHDYSTMDLALNEFLESVEQRAKKGIHLDPSGGYSVTDKADIESMAPRMDGESEAAYNKRIGEIEADEKAFVEGDGQFSLKREDTMRDNSVKYFEEYHVRGNKDRKYGPLRRNSITRQALDKANEMIAEMRDYIAPWYDREAGGNRYLPEEVYGLSTIFDNASYGATLENTLICTRTLAYNDFCDSVKRKLGRPLTKRESFLASQMLYDIATDPQCLYCYVSLDRKAYDEYLLRYFDERDAVIERYNKMRDKSAENIEALYKTFLDGRKDTYQMRSRFNSWLMLADHDSAIGRDKVALSSDRKNALAQESNEEAAVRWREITKQYNRLKGEEKKKFKQSKQYLDALHNYLATEQGQIKDACAYAQGASWAKKEAEYRSYTGELLRTTKRMLGGLASHYGLRFYSFSEYSPAFILENMQMVRDAALRGLKGFAYTKEIDFCKIFLPTGININCSTYGRRNAAGEIVMDERQGANWDEARALRDQYENMGIVFVATDDEMVRWAKEQPWIDVIIPFHIVRAGADIAEFYGWTNYTNVSADYDAQGRHKDIMPPEHNNSIEDYDRLIAERGLTRRFPQFYDGPGDQNYMKLINETRRKASDTPILTPVFNMEEAKKSFDKFVEKGGYWGGFYEVGADDVVRAVDEVAADIEAGKSAGEVEYGRQDIDFDSAMANLEKTRRRINRNREHGNVPKTSFSLKRESRDEDKVPTFYSNAAKAVENVKQNKATAEQWKAMLTKAGGIKAGEDKWMGLSQWLDEHKGQTLTKEEVAQFVADNGIKMEEVDYQEGLSASQQESLQELQDEYDGIISEYDAMYDQLDNEYNDFMIEMEEKYGDGWEYEMDGNERATEDRLLSERQKYGSQGEQWGMAWDEMVSRHGDDFNQGFYNDGTGTLAVSTDAHGNIDEAALYFLGEENGRPINSTRLEYTTEGLDNKREIAFVVPDVEPYQEGDEIHFGPENQGRAVMWVRFGEARDADGKRVLVIDEIQSNRHQDAREKGYREDFVQSELDQARQESSSYSTYLFNKYIRGKHPGEDFLDYATDEEKERFWELSNKVSDILKNRYHGVPAAPFEKNWHEVAMKRMLRLAAEEGFDKIAWTTGMQQADRYSLSHAVQSIAFNPEEDGSHSVFVTMQGGTMYEMVVGTDGMIESTRGNMFNGKNAVEVFGKEITDKIMNAEEPAELTGDDLRVGGYGMKSFYDGILPQYMNKYGKKWGVKTGTVELDLPNEGDWVMHSVDVTPEMKESVMQGQPLFSLKREDSQKVFDTAKRKFGETKDIREAGYVLPDGSMLDFSGRHELDPGTDSSFLAGRRATDHRAINQISFVYDENGDEVDTGVSSDMPDFIKRGAIRIDNNAGSINLSAAPTMAQRRVLRELIRRNGGDVQVDFGDGFDSDHYVEYEEASAQRVLGDIDRYFDEGIKPEGNVRFSLKREIRTDADGNEVYTETRQDGTKDREITTYSDGSKKALWYDDKGNLKERLDYFPNGEVKQVANYDSDGNLTRNIQYDENRRATSYYLPAIGTDWKLDENGIARGKSNGVEIKPYNFQFSLKREQTHSANFKRWFGDWENDPENASKVVDAEGKPLVVYHQTNAKRWINRETGEDWEKLDWRKKMEWESRPQEEWEEAWEEQDFYTFDDRYARQSIEMPAIFFSPENDPHHEYGNRTIAVYLNMRNPAINPDIPNRGVTDTAGRDAMEALKAQGYDGFIRTDEDGNIREYGVFDSNQVKSATENNGEFDPNNPDIRFSLKRRRNRDDYTDEDRADAAIIANTYLAKADALRQQIEADRQREHQLVEERNRLLAFEYPAADPADRPAIMDRINALRNQINDLRNANYENNTKLRSMDYEYRVAKEILNQGAVTDEEAARFDAGQMTREEQVLESLFKAAADSRADKKAKQKAVRGLVRELAAITDNFKAAMKARGIESQRKHYDKGTVDHIIRLAKAMMGTGYIDNMTSYEVKRLMGMINNAATRESIEEQAGRIVDMMLDHQIRTLRNDFDKQLKVTGQKTNSSGVQVQAGLDQEGQVVMDSYRKSMEIIADSAGERYDGNGYLTEWGEFYYKTLDDLGADDPVKAEQARKIFTGVLLAERWFNDVRAMEINDRILRSKIEDFKADNKPAKDADADTKQRYNDALADYQEMLRQNKIKIIEAYERITGDVGMTQAESVRRAKEFADKQKQRVNEIQHNANSDLADVDDNTQVETPESRVFGANKNNVLARLLFASAGTYEKFMRFFGRMAPNGEGYLFKRFMTQYHHARQNYWKGRHSAFEEMDRKMAEVFGKMKMHWSDIYEMTRDHKKFPPITVSYWDGYRNGQPFRREDELNQSEALYLYMINKMPDGRMKLRKMGITDDKVQQMADQIDGRLIQLADWLQNEFLPKMRIKYNETHKRVFGADMAAIEDYFPLRINELAVTSDMDITERDMNDNKPSTITGAIVKRRVNTKPIDLHTDAFDVALSHIDEMEHWSAYAEFNRDNNTLVNYNRFRTKVHNMKSLEFGAGNVLWKNFTDAVAIAADAYHPRAGSRSGDHYSTRVAKFVSTAKIALRPYTALKQLLSIPAFWADSDPLEQFKATVDVANTWQWAIENLPGFAERWQSRQAGNIKLANYNDLSGLRRRKAMQRLGRMGMWANAAIDGLACAMGGKAVYETKLKRYRKMGYDEARAQEKALIDAAIAYNNSQQSSEGAYVSPLQVDRTWFSNAFSVFRSASMGYTRRFNTSLRQLRKATTPGYGAQSVEFLKKQMMRDGLTEEQAEKWAHRIYRRANLKAAASVAIFGQILPFTWNLGTNMFYLLFGDDDKEKKKILADSFRHSFFGPVEGLVGGNVYSELGDIAADTAIGSIWGDSIWGDSNAFKALGYRDFSTMPLSSDINNVLKYFARDEVKAANEVVNILFQVATGVNPQTITDWATAILDLSRSDMERRDIAMFVMRMLSTPQQQLDKFYLDQMNLTQEQADKMSVDDLIKRYATYKRWRETPLTGWWMYSDEREKKVEEKFQKRYEEMLEERTAGEDGLRESINTTDDLPSKRTKMRKLQKELTDSTEAADPELYKKALEGEKADDDEYVRHVTDKDVEQMAELTMKKKALRAAYDRKKQADKDRVAGRINKEEYDAIYKECAHEWKLYNYLNSTLPKDIKEMKRKMEPGASKHNPEYWMDSIRTLTDEALQMRPEDMKMKKADRKHYQKKDKNK